MVASLAVVVALAAPTAPPVMTVAEAVELALVHNHGLRRARLDVERAGAQVDDAWSTVYPRVDATLAYTRIIEQPSPFAGSDGGGLFGQLGALGWLAYNEGARTDGNPVTEPLSYPDFLARQQRGLDAAGLELDSGNSDNPFFVPNRFDASLRLSQVLYNRAAFEAIRVAETYGEHAEAAYEDLARRVTVRICQGFYGALLAAASAEVLEKSVARTEQTVADTANLVEQGVAPRFQQLTAEVELANLRTELIGARGRAEAAVDALKLQVGLPVEEAVALRGDLGVRSWLKDSAGFDEAMARAERSRADLRQAAMTLRLAKAKVAIGESGYWPTLSLNATAGVQGTVPDDRTTVVSDPQDPFSFREEEEGFFSDAYWGPNVSVGLALSWNLFDGFSTTAKLDQDRLAVRQAESGADELRAAVALEVRQALRDLKTAEARIRSQERNLERAAQAYEHARLRVAEGVTTQLELRNANQQLDQSRLHHLQAVHDYLVAWIAFEAAVGSPPAELARVGEKR